MQVKDRTLGRERKGSIRGCEDCKRGKRAKVSSERVQASQKSHTYVSRTKELAELLVSYDGDVSIEEGGGEIEEGGGNERGRSERASIAELEDVTVDLEGELFEGSERKMKGERVHVGKD